ncbi:ABC transporter substrate-binding protein [Actinoplanes subglobosus]|uniref:ABC transporter substrate-binding protein n=1 Tax=Actinoplanes subglobosus TaxID=1547892 RepID=A0ABV8J2W2_9ACTN
MRSIRYAALALTTMTALAGCGTATATAEPGPATSAAGFPVDVTNCGRTLHFEEPPSRIVSGWASSTELLQALGAGDALAGQYNTASGQVPGVPVIGENAPGREQLLAARPQLIWADGAYLFDGKQLPTIDDLARQGIQVMILSGFCTDDATKATVRDVDTDLDALGRILGRPEQAGRLRAQVDARLTAVAGRVGDGPATPVAFLSTFDGQFYTYEGVYSDIARLAGATNVYSGVLPAGSYFAQMSVEDIAGRDPGTVVYLLGAGESEEAARAGLSRSLPTVTAVREGRVVFLSQSGTTNLAGVASVEKLAAALHP